VSDRPSEFRRYRQRMNERILESGTLETRRFFALDDRVYRDGALDSATKELLGLVASFTLRCDDCIAYHLVRCKEEGVSNEEIREALSVGLIVGGSITIPHMRRAVEFLDELDGGEDPGPEGSGASG